MLDDGEFAFTYIDITCALINSDLQDMEDYFRASWPLGLEETWKQLDDFLAPRNNEEMECLGQ